MTIGVSVLLFGGLTLNLHVPDAAALLQVLLIVQSHSGILHEGVTAVGPSAVEVSVDFVAWAIGQPAVDVPVVKLESIQYVDVVVEVLTVHNKHFLLVRHVEATVLVAVEMCAARVGTEHVRALVDFAVGVESLQAVVLNLQEEQNKKQKLESTPKLTKSDALTLLVGLSDLSSFESCCSRSLLLDGVEVLGLGNLKLVKIACGESIRPCPPIGL